MTAPKKPGDHRPADKEDTQQKASYQKDPRYRAFYDRLKKTGTRHPSTHDYDEEVRPMSIDELDKSGWDGTLKEPSPPPPPPPHSSQLVFPPPAKQAPIVPTPQPPQPQQQQGALKPGVIARFDDDSVAVYKDAVSGKDYALFYFLEPNGVLAPRGIFVEQYEVQRIGELPHDLFEQMRMAGTWDRDAVIFHLDRYDLATYIRRLENRTPYSPADTPMPRQRAAAMPPPQQQSEPQPQPQPTPSPEAPQTQQDPQAPPPPRHHRRERPVTQLPPERDPLVRGRVLKINVAGKLWDAVYWTKDEIGPIVAHDTNREWSLMHLNLERFKDSLEYGEILSAEELQEIEDSLAKSHKH